MEDLEDGMAIKVSTISTARKSDGEFFIYYLFLFIYSLFIKQKKKKIRKFKTKCIFDTYMGKR